MKTKLSKLELLLKKVNERISLLSDKLAFNNEAIKIMISKTSEAVVCTGYKETKAIKDVDAEKLSWIYAVKKSMLSSLPKDENSGFDWFVAKMTYHGYLSKKELRRDVSSCEKYFKALKDTDAIAEETEEISLAIDVLKDRREALLRTLSVLKHGGMIVMQTTHEEIDDVLKKG